MFYDKSKTIHHPESIRKMNMEAWLQGNIIEVNNVYKPSVGDHTTLDLLDMENEIAHGLLYCNYFPERDYFEFIFKHESGAYTAYGFNDGEIVIPIPTLYIVGRIDTSIQSDGIYVSTYNMDVASPHLKHLPLSNVFSSGSSIGYDLTKKLNKHLSKPISSSKLCSGDALNEYINTYPCKTLEETISKMMNYMTAFLMANGNLDLSLYNGESSGSNGMSIYNIINEAYNENVRNDATRFRIYWTLLHLALAKNTPDEIYQILSETTNSQRLLERLGVTVDQVRKEVKDNPYNLEF